MLQATCPLSYFSIAFLSILGEGPGALTGLFAGIVGAALRSRLNGRVPELSGGAILAGLALFVLVRQTAVIGAALQQQEALSLLDRASIIADFVVVVPLLLVGGVQLWRRAALGYAVGAGLLPGYGVLAR